MKEHKESDSGKLLQPDTNNYANTYDDLLAILPHIAKFIIAPRIENENFKKNPDDPNEHAVNWHQFGIITHTSFVLKAFQKETQELLRKWNIYDKINVKFKELIDSKTKLELLQISIVLHDLGKFDRNFEEIGGKFEHNFYGHEALSEKLIKENYYINNLLRQKFKLATSQIDYIARCAGLHFELGKSRNAAKKTTTGYSIAFSSSIECKNSCQEIASMFPEFKYEIGILFLCDNLAKTDIRIDVNTDEEIKNKSSEIEHNLKKRNLNPNLIAAIKQLPVSIEVARKYLDIL